MGLMTTKKSLFGKQYKEKGKENAGIKSRLFYFLIWIIQYKSDYKKNEKFFNFDLTFEKSVLYYSYKPMKGDLE